jgi:hypothetical protein
MREGGRDRLSSSVMMKGVVTITSCDPGYYRKARKCDVN